MRWDTHLCLLWTILDPAELSARTQLQLRVFASLPGIGAGQAHYGTILMSTGLIVCGSPGSTTHNPLPSTVHPDRLASPGCLVIIYLDFIVALSFSWTPRLSTGLVWNKACKVPCTCGPMLNGYCKLEQTSSLSINPRIPGIGTLKLTPAPWWATGVSIHWLFLHHWQSPDSPLHLLIARTSVVL